MCLSSYEPFVFLFIFFIFCLFAKGKKNKKKKKKKEEKEEKKKLIYILKLLIYYIIIIIIIIINWPHTPHMLTFSHVSHAVLGIAFQPKVCQRQTTAIGSQHTRKNSNLIMESNADSVEAMMEAGAVAVAGGVAAIGSLWPFDGEQAPQKYCPPHPRPEQPATTTRRRRRRRRGQGA